MQLNLPTKAEAAAFGRHVANSAASVAGTLAVLHVIPGSDATTIQTSIQHIQNGLAELYLGIWPLITLGIAYFAAWTASHPQQAKAVAAIPNTTIVTGPELAAATPGQPNIVSNTEVKVVPK